MIEAGGIPGEVARGYAPWLSDARIEPLGSAGGFSGAAFWRIVQGAEGHYLRRWPRSGPSRERLSWIHDVLRHVAARGFDCFPLPVVATTGQSFLDVAGHFWELAPELPGKADFHENPSEARLAAAMAVLAGFHRAAADYPRRPVERLASPNVLQRLTQVFEELARGPSFWIEAIRRTRRPHYEPRAWRIVQAFMTHAGALAPLLEQASHWRVPLQPAIRDIWRGNVLYRADEVTGLVDFGSAGNETPAADVARLLGSLAGDDTRMWQVGLQSYEAVRPLSDLETRLVGVLDRSTVLLSGLTWIQWIYLEGREFPQSEPVVQRLDEILARLERLQPTQLLGVGF